MLHYYADERAHAPARLPGHGAGAALRPRRGAIGWSARWRSNSESASAGSRPIRWRPAMTSAPTRRCWPPTSRASRRRPGWWRRPSASLTGVHRYPDPSYVPLRQALSDRYGVPRERIALGNGSCDILLSAGEALLEPGAEVVYAWPAFSVYPHLAAASGARAIEVPLDDEDRHDLDAMAAEITVATRLVLICNPNNPTSTSLPLDEVARVHGAGAAPRVRHPRRGLLRVRAGPGRHLRLAGSAAPLAQPRAAADLLQGLRARRPARRLRAVRVRGLPRRRGPGAPALLPQHGRAGRRRGGAAPPGRGRAPRHPHRGRARSS